MRIRFIKDCVIEYQNGKQFYNKIIKHYKINDELECVHIEPDFNDSNYCRITIYDFIDKTLTGCANQKTFEIISLSDFTIGIIKPNILAKRKEGQIIDLILSRGFELHGLKIKTMTFELISDFYSEHANKDFFPKHREFLGSGNSLFMLLKKKDAIKSFRELMKAIRMFYAEDNPKNAIHGSSSEYEFLREINILNQYHIF